MASPAAQTNIGPMLAVAVEQHLPQGQKLIQDDLACQFLSAPLRLFVKLTRWSPLMAALPNLADKRGPGVWGGVLCRKRYIDDRLLEAVRADIGALVILGAGLDTRAYRLAALAAMPVFEVDLPENIAYKKARLQQLFGSVPAHVKLASVDLEEQDLGNALAPLGYQSGQKSFFICEAVTQYLTEAGNRKVFGFLAQAASGSRLVFTYIRKDFIDGSQLYGSEALYQVYRGKRQIWRFGLAPEQVSAFLRDYSWKELEQVGAFEYTSRYLRPIGRALPVTEIERAVYAEKS